MKQLRTIEDSRGRGEARRASRTRKPRANIARWASIESARD
jgi:hypothetical protein